MARVNGVSKYDSLIGQILLKTRLPTVSHSLTKNLNLTKDNQIARNERQTRQAYLWF